MGCPAGPQEIIVPITKMGKTIKQKKGRLDFPPIFETTGAKNQKGLIKKKNGGGAGRGN